MADLVTLVDQSITLVRDGERADLRRRLEQTRRRLLDPAIRVFVVGEFKQGKSMLINALVGAPVCPVDDDVATAVPTVVRHGEQPTAAVLLAGGGEDAAPERRPVPLEDLPRFVTEAGNPGNTKRLVGAEVTLPRAVLAGGLAVVDSPGVGGLDSAHALATLTALPAADAVLVVSDASQEYTEPEMHFLRQAMRVCPNVAAVLSKTDLYPQWRRVADLDRGHLARVAADIPLFPVSSVLRLHAGQVGDQELNAESGFPALVAYLRREIVGQAERLQRRSVAHDLLSTAEHLRLALSSELSALQDPERTPQLLAELEVAKDRADEQRKRSARWQVTLNDGMADLIADMDYDLRDRLRAVQREAEQAIDAGDPGPVWDQFADWLEQRVASAVSETFVWTAERSQWLAEQVGDLFAEDDVSLPLLHVEDTDDVLDPVAPVPDLDPGHVSAVQKVLIGMRGSYGGVLMFGLLTGIAGLSLINPISVGAGVLLGGKVYRDDKENRLKRRQAEAKSIVRRQVDDVTFQVGKQLRDRLRVVQRAIRDHFTEIAEEHHRSLTDSVLVAQRAATVFTAEREQRIKTLQAELARVEALRRRAEALGKEATAPRSGGAPASGASAGAAPAAGAGAVVP
ncbi:dynamin family protein [Georgenia thermotolerans]|uniref:Isoniazid-inducible protein iniA n=1 Tax=Georgenia thermotolerans TaxID=527326 RepID=A0A7J5UJZ5_9MICO|nr:dynamin family protein [Georgenia thermotolerans]KAE8762646.1 Isoniazid-inducible protein iniA [Georgenia thermotolerans]